ncbi:hypothetical protein LLEC1_04937 [Akanthomyces lecanii]|uniref:SRR1-like domain-containing protein n=1 Tax=Cordyceps confragosa TaxID=2714763 RepID=A0A179IKQ7_CORDF|nr:hypothetical protein LLEC1_04937 [Akanthomyces lecanii]
MAVDGGWTHVKRKSRRSASSPSKPATATHTFAPRTTGVLRPPEALRADHDRIHAQWLASPAHEALIQLVDEHAKDLRVCRVVCLGIGTFDPDDGAWEAKRAAHAQLCALSTLTSQLQRYSKGSIECIFQEPIFTHSDESLLRALGHRVVASPAAYELIDDATLLFAVHLYRPIYAAALKSSLPAIFVGTGWDVWDTVMMEKSSDLENMKKMDEIYTRHAFPQDAASTAFSSTSIYFRPLPDSAPLESAPQVARPPSPEASLKNKTDNPPQQSTAKDTTSKRNSAAQVSAAASTDKHADTPRDKSEEPDECADDKAGHGMSNEAKEPRLKGTRARDKPNNEQDIPSEEKQGRK